VFLLLSENGVSSRGDSSSLAASSSKRLGATPAAVAAKRVPEVCGPRRMAWWTTSKTTRIRYRRWQVAGGYWWAIKGEKGSTKRLRQGFHL